MAYKHQAGTLWDGMASCSQETGHTRLFGDDVYGLSQRRSYYKAKCVRTMVSVLTDLSSQA
jgi:hypothetical protein